MRRAESEQKMYAELHSIKNTMASRNSEVERKIESLQVMVAKLQTKVEKTGETRDPEEDKGFGSEFSRRNTEEGEKTKARTIME
ncbi:hypothetical protein GUJ93_ZPchr0013g36332 [Zizania palustris]|uniref:Uncharacterized protein n=1 Tax=Zizania palustris TaxID=103762 RepID=A0A8J5X859_ZIZPA|nr:hypothetical protein GUJ93_ZPchr0013g36332 [Zizania palustris]